VWNGDSCHITLYVLHYWKKANKWRGKKRRGRLALLADLLLRLLLSSSTLPLLTSWPSSSPTVGCCAPILCVGFAVGGTQPWRGWTHRKGGKEGGREKGKEERKGWSAVECGENWLFPE